MTKSETKVRDPELLALVAGAAQVRTDDGGDHDEDGRHRTEQGTELDVSDLDRWMGVPMEPGELKEPITVNDIRRFVQGMHYPNPLHYDERWAAESHFGQIIAPQSFTVATDTSHGCSPAQIGKIPNSHLIFGGDEWWFFGPRIYPGDHLVCHRMPFDYKVRDTSFAGPTCFQRGDTLYINQKRRAGRAATVDLHPLRVRQAKEKKLFVEPAEKEWDEDELLRLEEIKGGFIQPDPRPPSRQAAVRVGAGRRQARAQRARPALAWPASPPNGARTR